MPSKSDESYLVEMKKVYDILGWPYDKKLAQDEVDRVKALVWKLRREQERQVKRSARDPRPMDVVGSVTKTTCSPIEEILTMVMNTRSMFIGEFVKQFPVGPYFLDVAFPKVKLCVEADGKDYHSSPADIARDQRRDSYLSNLGWTVLRFTGTEINKSAHQCADRIQHVYSKLLEREKLPEPWER